jgi:hypothetical protein
MPKPMSLARVALRNAPGGTTVAGKSAPEISAAESKTMPTLTRAEGFKQQDGRASCLVGKHGFNFVF